MGLVDAFSKEDRIDVKFSTLYDLLYEAAKCQLITNAVNADVPNEYIRAIITDDEVTPRLAPGEEMSISERVAENIRNSGITVGHTEVDDE